MTTKNYQFTINAEGVFAPEAFGKDFPPIVMGSDFIGESFAPMDAEVTEIISATYGSESGPDITIEETVKGGKDTLLVQAFVGNINCFPHAPDTSKGVPGPDVGRLVSDWPPLHSGPQFSIAFAIQHGVLKRARKGLTKGYNPTPKSIKVQVRLTLSGPVVR